MRLVSHGRESCAVLGSAVELEARDHSARGAVALLSMPRPDRHALWGARAVVFGWPQTRRVLAWHTSDERGQRTAMLALHPLPWLRYGTRHCRAGVACCASAGVRLCAWGGQRQVRVYAAEGAWRPLKSQRPAHCLQRQRAWWSTSTAIMKSLKLFCRLHRALSYAGLPWHSLTCARRVTLTASGRRPSPPAAPKKRSLEPALAGLPASRDARGYTHQRQPVRHFSDLPCCAVLRSGHAQHAHRTSPLTRVSRSRLL
jgi:hypothetical protein